METSSTIMVSFMTTSVQVGDTVDLTISKPINITIKDGVVTAVFDLLTEKLETGINLEIDIRYGPGKRNWFRYKPYRDGGTFTVKDR